LVGHYLLRKINGTLSPIAMALIPECDVYGDEEPWEIWSRFGAADDRSLFLLSPLKKKKKSSSNGTVIARRIGSEGGTWHEDSKKHHPVDGMILKAVERQFSYRNLNPPKKRKFPWLLKEFTLDNYPGGNYAVCELRKTGCNSAVCPPDSHYAPLPCHLLSSTTENEMMMMTPDGSSPPPNSLPPSSTTETEVVEDSEYAAELDRILDLIDFSGCEDEEITASPPQSQVEIDAESHFLLSGKDDGFINIENYNMESLGDGAALLVYDGALTSSNDLEPAPTKLDDMDDMEYAPWWKLRGFLQSNEVHIFGYARTKISEEELRNRIRGYLDKNAANEPSEEVLKFLQLIKYISSSYDNEEGFKLLDKAISEHEESKNSAEGSSRRLFYHALPPSVYPPVCRMIRKCCMNKSHMGGWTRVVIEKPFGKDLESSERLSTQIGELFEEPKIYRIDHYLGKELVQNMLVLHFANRFFLPLWKRDNIANVQISFREDFGTEGRGGYFDEYVIIHDIIQNHLLQVLCLVAMEKPVSLKPEHIRDEKVKVLQSVLPINDEEVVLGQYDGYKDDPTVPGNSNTPTFATVVLRIHNERWE
ncbi:hypothetical protein Tsubulata_051091, partial [Turnera subulata]